MEKKKVFLKIYIDYDNKNILLEETSEFKTLEEIKAISIEKLDISEDDSEFICFFCRENNKEKKTSLVQSDTDLIKNMEEKDEYNYVINLELKIDKTIQEKREKLRKIFIKYFLKSIFFSFLLFRNYFYLEKYFKGKIRNYITNKKQSRNEILKNFPNEITFAKKENDEKINNIYKYLFCPKPVIDIRNQFNKKMEEIKAKGEEVTKRFQDIFNHSKEDISDFIKKKKDIIKNEKYKYENKSKKDINYQGQKDKKFPEGNTPYHSENLDRKKKNKNK